MCSLAKPRLLCFVISQGAIMGVFRYTLPVLAVLKNYSAITTQHAATASSSLNDVINDSHIATAITAAFEVKQLQCNIASLKEAQRIENSIQEIKNIYIIFNCRKCTYIHFTENDLNSTFEYLLTVFI